MTAKENTLHEGLRRHDPGALDQAVAEYSGAVLYLAGLILGQAGRPEDAEEIASDVFAAAWERIDQFDPARSSFRSWVLMLTKYLALDRRRRLLRQSYTPEGEAKVISLTAAPEPETTATPEDELVRRERQERLHEALEQLSEADRQLLIRRYFLEEPIADLAREGNLSRSAIDNRLWRARQALKALLSGKREVHGGGHQAL